jgi:hypothetical protein
MSCQHNHTVLSHKSSRFYCKTCEMDVTGLERARDGIGLQPELKAGAPLTGNTRDGHTVEGNRRKVKRENHA